jgi:uncharacterized LabA/DUF88 family protein
MNVGVFVDVSNLYVNLFKKFPGRKLDYGRYLEVCKQYGKLYRAVAYGLEVNGEAAGFKMALRSKGYDVRFKRLHTNDVKRSSWNVGMTLDVVRLLQKLDVVVLGTSDGSMSELASYVREQRIWCVAFAHGAQKELREVCNQHLDIREDMLEAPSAT